MNKKILFVDDEPEVLNSFRRQLRNSFEIETASSGLMALEIVSTERPFAVIVADMHMPQMNGIELLSRVEKLQPNTTRIMLTGKPDLETAMNAVNEGKVFRFLIKPCSQEIMIKSLRAGIRQYDLIMSERVLLEQTLSGSIDLMVEMLNLAFPKLYQKTVQAQKYIKHITLEMDLANSWKYELALSLSQIGLLAYPKQFEQIIDNMENYVFEESFITPEYHHIGRKLLENIPRMNEIAVMVQNQKKPYMLYESDVTIVDSNAGQIGGQILMVTMDLVNLIEQGHSQNEALTIMRKRIGHYNPEMLSVLQNYKVTTSSMWEKRRIKITELKIGMIIDEDIILHDNTIYLSKGQKVSNAILKRLLLLHENKKYNDFVYVLVPTYN